MEKLENNIESEKYIRAKKRVEELKSYYWHLAIYLGVNTLISVRKIIRNLDNGETFNEAFFDLGTFVVWAFWGIGILLHTLNVFGSGIFLGRKWEEEKIKELMNK